MRGCCGLGELDPTKLVCPSTALARWLDAGGCFALISFYPIMLCGIFNPRNMAERKRKPKFSKEELDILVTEVTRNEAMLFGRETIRLSHADRDKIWEGIARQITSVSQVPRSVKDIKHRWDDMKRRTKDKLALMQRSLSSPSSAGQPSAIILTAHERAIQSALHSSHQRHCQRADLDMVDSLTASCKYHCLNTSLSPLYLMLAYLSLTPEEHCMLCEMVGLPVLLLWLFSALVVMERWDGLFPSIGHLYVFV